MRNHRITVGLKDSAYQALAAMKEETGQSMSEILAELVDTVEPVLVRLVALQRMAREAREGWKEKQAEEFEEISGEFERVLAAGLQLMDRATGQPPYGNTGVRLVHARESRDKKQVGKGG
jgi:predicted CopG family antitoxin